MPPVAFIVESKRDILACARITEEELIGIESVLQLWARTKLVQVWRT